MKHIKMFEGFLNESESLEMAVSEFIKYPGISFEDGDLDVVFNIDGEYAGEYRFSGIYNGYIVAEVIFVEPKFKRKGIYSAIIDGAVEYCKATKKAKGIMSAPYDADGMDIPRSPEANAFWDGVEKKGKARRKDTEDGPEYYSPK
jgi:GNAT superfamily N-acetyltransferase